ncbi:hypothetical protein AAG906_033320 [Vitis piasezkii]
MSKAKGKAEAEDIMYKNRGISIETSPNDGTLCHPASSEIAAWPMARLTIPSTVKQFLMSSYINAENLLLGPNGLWKFCDFGSTSTNHKHFKKPEEMDIEEDNTRKRKPINEKVDIWHREKIEATDWELQQRKSVSLAQTLIFGRLSLEAGAQTTIASLLGPKCFRATLLPALIFPDPPLEAIMPSCLLTQRRLRASWLLNLLNGLVSNLFGEVISSWALLAIRDGNRIQHLHMFPGFHGLLTNLYCSECLDFQNHLKPGPWNKLKPFCTEQLDSLKFLICKYPKTVTIDLLSPKGIPFREEEIEENVEEGRFLGAELLMFIALFKKNKLPSCLNIPHSPSDACECSSLVAYQKLSQSKYTSPWAPPERKLDKEPLLFTLTTVTQLVSLILMTVPKASTIACTQDSVIKLQIFEHFWKQQFDPTSHLKEVVFSSNSFHSPIHWYAISISKHGTCTGSLLTLQVCLPYILVSRERAVCWW